MASRKSSALRRTMIRSWGRRELRIADCGLWGARYARSSCPSGTIDNSPGQGRNDRRPGLGARNGLAQTGDVAKTKTIPQWMTPKTKNVKMQDMTPLRKNTDGQSTDNARRRGGTESRHDGKHVGAWERASARPSRGLVPRQCGTAVYGPVRTVVWDSWLAL